MTRARTTAAAAAAAALTVLAISLPAGVTVAAKTSANLQLGAGARIGVVNLLDGEVTHFHASRRVQDSFLKTYTVNWPMHALLMDALKERLTLMGLAPVAVAASEALRRGRESCLLNATLTRGLPKGCGGLFAQLAAAEHVDALIVLAPGLNNSAHADGNRRRDLPEYLRGWCFVGGEGAANSVPALLNLTELLLIRLSATGAEIAARQWGGDQQLYWSTFKPPADLKDIPQQQLAELRPLFGAMLKQQAEQLLGHLEVNR